MREVTNDELKKVVYGINSAFGNVTSFNMPYPGPTVVSASASTKQWKVRGKWITGKKAYHTVLEAYNQDYSV